MATNKQVLKRLDELIKLLTPLMGRLWVGNYDDRIAELVRRFEEEEPRQDLRDKKMKAIEQHFGITFKDQGYKYEKKHIEKKIRTQKRK